jgi:hypothetical protein
VTAKAKKMLGRGDRVSYISDEIDRQDWPLGGTSRAEAMLHPR